MTDAITSPDELWVCHLGVVPYLDGLAVQQRLLELRQADEVADVLLMLEHPPTYTRGRRSADDELPFGEQFYRDKGIEVHTTNRGGRVTYHAPGQLVGYPIMRVTDVGAYLRTMESAIAHALGEIGIAARGRPEDGPDYTGVWVQDRKIASIGVHVSRGVATHGFAVNVDLDLDPFTWVVACGLPDVTMTSIAREIEPAGAACESIACFRKRMAHSYARTHGRRQRLVSPQRLGIANANPSLLARRAHLDTAVSPLGEAVPA